MPEITYPGIYVEEQRGRPTVTAAPTSVAAFIGAVAVSEPTPIYSLTEYEGLEGVDETSPLTLAVRAFFANGGKRAVIVGVEPAAGDLLSDDDIVAALAQLTAPHVFNLLVIPPLGPQSDLALTTWAAAAELCRQRRALLLIDAPAAWGQAGNPVAAATQGVADLRAVLAPETRAHAALYFPRLATATGEIAPGGAVAGMMARVDQQRGIWKSPAALEATLSDVIGPCRKLSDVENGALNPLGINCLRSFPAARCVVWGARTLAGGDDLASDWKYIPVARLGWFIETSVMQSLGWTVFERNDATLWAEIRKAIAPFLDGLFRQGAFAGETPRESYVVKCDETTTTAADIAAGKITIEIAFAPLKPAEFIMLRVQAASAVF